MVVDSSVVRNISFILSKIEMFHTSRHFKGELVLKLHEAEVKPSHGQNDGSVQKVPLSFWVFVLIWHQTEGVGSGQVVRWNFNPSLHQGTCCFSGNWAWRWGGSIVCLQNDSLTFPVSSQVEGDVRDWSLMSLWGAIARLSWQDWFKWGWANALRILGT